MDQVGVTPEAHSRRRGPRTVVDRPGYVWSSVSQGRPWSSRYREERGFGTTEGRRVYCRRFRNRTSVPGRVRVEGEPDDGFGVRL